MRAAGAGAEAEAEGNHQPHCVVLTPFFDSSPTCYAVTQVRNVDSKTARLQFYFRTTRVCSFRFSYIFVQDTMSCWCRIRRLGRWAKQRSREATNLERNQINSIESLSILNTCLISSSLLNSADENCDTPFPRWPAWLTFVCRGLGDTLSTI